MIPDRIMTITNDRVTKKKKKPMMANLNKMAMMKAKSEMK